MSNNLCIIPARGGSKRIPQKNIKDFLGKPIIAYSIQTAVDSGLFAEVMVSTDDSQIADVAQEYGASVPFLRSKENSDDFATTLNVIAEVLEKYQNELDRKFDYVCCLYATAPLVTKEKLADGLDLIKQGGYASVFPVVRYGHPIWRGMLKNGSNVSFIWEENIQKRTQDLDAVFHDAGQWYWLIAQNLPDTLLSNKSSSIEIVDTEVQDIDNPVDWELAELKYKLINESKV